MDIESACRNGLVRGILERVLLLVLVCAWTGPAFATAKTPAKHSAPPSAMPAFPARDGGETITDAVPLPDIFQGTGTTCGHFDDYDEACPYNGSTSPDVVYSYRVEHYGTSLIVNLCDSSYDTKIYIYDAEDLETPIACNDDAGCGYSGFQSKLEWVQTEAGHLYYVVVDGYGGACGAYSMYFEAHGPDGLYCPEGALAEGEPPCGPGYDDRYNSGCDGAPGPWQRIDPQEGGCATMCGKSCSFEDGGVLKTDTDWFTLTAAGGTTTVTAVAEFPARVLLAYVTDCGALQYESVDGEAFHLLDLGRALEPGQEFWICVLPTADYPMSWERTWFFTVCGIQAGTSAVPEEAVERTTWGGIKARF